MSRQSTMARESGSGEKAPALDADPVSMEPKLEAVRPGFAAAKKVNRLDYVDAVRVLLIVLVVAHHSVEPYVVPHPPELQLTGPPIPHAWVFLWVNAAFFMGLFFFLAGYFTIGAYERRTPASFVHERLRRLGI